MHEVQPGEGARRPLGAWFELVSDGGGFAAAGSGSDAGGAAGLEWSSWRSTAV